MSTKKKPYPPRKRASVVGIVTEGMPAAAAALGVTLDVIKAAKKAGAPGFRSGRVYLDELGPWLAANPLPNAADGPAQDISTARLQKVNEEVRKLKLVNDLKAGILIDRASVAQALGALCGQWNSIRTRAESEAPARMAGMEAPECRVVFRQVMDEIGAAIADCAQLFAENNPKPTTPDDGI